MKEWKSILPVFVIFCLFILACSSGPSIDKGRFARLSLAAHEVKKFVAAGESYSQVTDRVRQLSVEIEALQESATAGDEKRLLQAYEVLLSIYRDGLVLWKYKLDFAFFDSQLKGRIYVGQDVDPIVEKYRLPTESHLYKPTGQYWKSISGDSIQLMWRHADSQLKVIDNIANY
jgi:hypothetical protein